MLSIKHQVSLLSKNTFGISATADTFVASDNIAELQDYLRTAAMPVLVLGGGSNLLFVSDSCPLVVHPTLKGIERMDEDRETVLIRACAGEVWDDLVMWSIARNYSGLENLSLIPGNVGACPVQNIGAYGAEAQNVIETVEALHIADGKLQQFSRAECRFGYRDSFFKQNKGKYLIVSVTFRLSKTFVANLTYSGLKSALPNENISIAMVRDAVVNMRRQKLPDYQFLGNAGSFFKNPAVSLRQAEVLKSEYPPLPVYAAGEGLQKLSAAWLIEQCGWKGKRSGNVGAYERHPLILVNYGGASGKEVLDFANEIIRSVDEKFGVRMESEVNIV
ncbi:UDP-N-acetylenolpyruvoylglucosamine reductase [Bacteroidia bacterium]|nr:UDP-N-acetylenolpyruvoylglucosamine reductase [Bacteroidia bacterium]